MEEKIQKIYDLEERTFNFAKNSRNFSKKLPRNIENFEDIKQLIRSSGSVAADYIEAKESSLFLRLVDTGNKNEIEENRKNLIKESIELVKIFNSIVEKTKQKININD